MAEEETPRILDVIRLIMASALSSTERHVLHVYAMHCDGKTWRTYVGPECIGRETGVSVKTVKRARKALRDQGILVVTARRGNGRATDHHRLDWRQIPPRTDPAAAEDGDNVSPSPPAPQDEQGQNDPMMGTEDPHRTEQVDGDSVSPSSGMGTDCPPDGDTVSADGDTESLISDLDLRRSAGEDIGARPDPVARVCRRWWDLWEARAPHVEGKARQRQGPAAGAPATPELTADDRDAIRKLLRAKRPRSVEDLELVAEWAFGASEWHARHLRGEAKPEQPINEHLSPVACYRPTKFAAKLSKAVRWRQAGRPTGSVQRSNGRGYQSMDDLFGSRTTVSGPHDPDDWRRR